MALNLLPSDKPAWAYGGIRETITPEKWRTGWTGSASDYAFAAWINEILYQLFTDNGNIARTTNKLIQICGTPYNALFEYPQDALMTFNNKLYIARKPNSGNPPTGDKDDENWQIVTGVDWVTEQLAKKVNADSGELTGTPTTSTPTKPYTNQKQIANVELVLKECNDRVRGESIIDLSKLDETKAYPVLFCKDGKPTDTTISRHKGFGKENAGNMRLLLQGIGSGNAMFNNSYYYISNGSDTSDSEIKNFVKKIESKAGNSTICVWLRGGLKYHCFQRLNDSSPQVVETTQTLENNWIVGLEPWQEQLKEYVKDGAWQGNKQESFLIDYSSTSDTGAVSTCGVVIWCAGKQPVAGSLQAYGQAISRATYGKLFNYIGTQYGVGDGSTTFALPDLRGVAVVGLDLGRGMDSNQLVTKAGGVDATNNRRDITGLGSFQSDAIRNISGGFQTQNNEWGATGQFTNYYGCFLPNSSSYSKYNYSSSAKSSNYASAMVFNANVPTASKNQTNNIALLGCIYYL